MIAKRVSDIGVCEGGVGGRGVSKVAGEVGFKGRHLSTLSMLARAGWHWSGYENMTRMTMARRPIVEATLGGSVLRILELRIDMGGGIVGKEGKTYT